MGSRNAGTCEENVVEIANFLKKFTLFCEYIEMLISHLWLDVRPSNFGRVQRVKLKRSQEGLDTKL